MKRWTVFTLTFLFVHDIVSFVAFLLGQIKKKKWLDIIFILVIHFWLHLGNLADAFFFLKVTKNKYLSEERETTLYFAVGTVKILIETSAKHVEFLG